MDLVFHSPEFNVGIVGRVVCVTARGAMTLEHARALGTAYSHVVANHGAFFTITVTMAKKPGLSDEAKAHLLVLANQFREHDQGAAVVLAQAGFSASVVRALIGGVTLFTGGNIKIFGDVDVAVAWLEAVVEAQHLDSFDSAAIRAALLSLALPPVDVLDATR